MAETSVFKIDPQSFEESLLVGPAEVIRDGGLVVFPTETVYGLGANALNSRAVMSIFEAKGRPQDNPLICHISDYEGLSILAKAVPKCAEAMAEAFWPGPLTMIFPKAGCVPYEVSAGLDTVAVRMPSNEIARSLIRLSGVPVAAPSANLSGRPSPTSFEHVQHDMFGKVDVIIDGGECGVGVESTVVDVSVWPPVVLRPGGVTMEQLTEVVPEVRLFEGHSSDVTGSGPARSPGLRHKHYAPRAAVYLLEGTGDEQATDIEKYLVAGGLNGRKTGFMVSEETMSSLYSYISSRENCDIQSVKRFCEEKMANGPVEFCNGAFAFEVVGRRDDLTTVAHGLFRSLRDLDEAGVEVILAETFPEIGMGLAIMNRLSRSAGGKKARDLLNEDI